MSPVVNGLDIGKWNGNDIRIVAVFWKGYSIYAVKSVTVDPDFRELVSPLVDGDHGNLFRLQPLRFFSRSHQLGGGAARKLESEKEENDCCGYFIRPQTDLSLT